MSGPVWRAILWTERFLPVPRPLTAETARAAEARGRAAFVPMLVFPMIVVPTLIRERHALGEILRHDHVVLAQMMLVVAGGIVAAMIAFGAKAWRDAKGAR